MQGQMAVHRGHNGDSSSSHPGAACFTANTNVPCLLPPPPALSRHTARLRMEGTHTCPHMLSLSTQARTEMHAQRCTHVLFHVTHANVLIPHVHIPSILPHHVQIHGHVPHSCAPTHIPRHATHMEACAHRALTVEQVATLPASPTGMPAGGCGGWQGSSPLTWE